MSLPADHDLRLARARLSLDGLSLGDPFGEGFFISPVAEELPSFLLLFGLPTAMAAFVELYSAAVRAR